jgi:hypothetical protein
MRALRQQGVDAHYLEGGIEAWREQALPVMSKPPGATTRWVTRARPRVDRIACPWLIRRFVDASAEFLRSDRAGGRGGATGSGHRL